MAESTALQGRELALGHNSETEAVFKNVVFAGGGSRCFWQIGFWDGANRSGLGLNRTIDYAASTSAGCAFATVALLDRGPQALSLFKEMTARNARNIYWRHLKPGVEEPVLPHFRMYRGALEAMLSHQDRCQLGDKRREFLMAKCPRYLLGGLGTAAAFAVYGLEKRLVAPVHLSWARKMGFKPVVGGNQDAEDLPDFINMILAASTVPPVLPRVDHRGESVLDGGFIDNAPAFLTDGRSGRTLVLLSKHFRKPLPAVANRVYVQPSEPIKIDKFDYANPEVLQQSYDLGFEDGCRFAASKPLAVAAL